MAEVLPVKAGKLSRHVFPQIEIVQRGSFTPDDIRAMYNIPAGAQTDATVAVVVAGSSPNVEAELAAYRATYGMPECTVDNKCLTIVNQDGDTAPLPPVSEISTSAWLMEIAMDVQAVSAACESCNILLVNAANSGLHNLRRAVNTATDLGAEYVSMSYGSPEFDGQEGEDGDTYTDAGVTFVASSGDYGYSESLWPSASTSVVSAGGTSVEKVNNSSFRHSAWSGAGSGCSPFEAQPAYQAAEPAVADACGNRATSDISALADPASGMLVYHPSLADDGNTYDWWLGGGTSLSAPLLAGMYALAGNNTNAHNVYDQAAINPANFTDIIAGSTSDCDGTVLCKAAPGWDGATGVGSPLGLAGLTSGEATPAPIALRNPGAVNAIVGTAVSWDASAEGDGPHTYSATGVPDGLSLDNSTGRITGTPVAAGSGSITVTVTGETIRGQVTTGTVTFSYEVADISITPTPEPTPTPTPTPTPEPTPAPSPDPELEPTPDPVTVTLANPGPVKRYLGERTQWSIAAGTAGTYEYSATGIPAGMILNQIGTINGTPTAAGTGTITVSLTGTTNTGAPASGSVSFDYTVAAHTFARVGNAKVTGIVKKGKKVKAAYGTFRADTKTGAKVHPKVTITWYLNGKVIKGAKTMTLRIKPIWAKKRLKFQVTAVADNYTPLTFNSSVKKIR